MERKLVKQGQNALTVTLPANWIHQSGLSAGNTVSIREESGELVVSSQNATKITKSSIDITNQSSQELWHLFQAAYFRGDDEIEILHNDPALVEKVIPAHIGMVLTRHTGTKSIAKSIVTVPEDDFDNLLRRCIFMFKEQVSLVAQGKPPSECKAMERQLDMHIRYCIRYVVKYYKKNDNFKQFYLLMSLEENGDRVSELAKRNLSGTQLELLSTIIGEFCSAILNKDFSAAKKLHKIRKSIPKNTYEDALLSDILESLYNNFGYLST